MLQLDLNKTSHQLIVAALGMMIDDEGLTVHQVAEVLEDIKRQTFPALSEMSRENKGKEDTAC